MHLQNTKKLEDPNIRASIHSLPCKIHADGNALVSKYFNSSINYTKEGYLTASFRGYPLIGTVLNLPEGYIGTVLQERIKNLDKDERKLYVVNSFDKMMQWNWGKNPTKNDAIQQVFDWIDVAEILHSSIEDE